jgi:hypothetical protein
LSLEGSWPREGEIGTRARAFRVELDPPSHPPSLLFPTATNNGTVFEGLYIEKI